jgi:HEAT repeat protein
MSYRNSGGDELAMETIARLGGRERALPGLRLYARLPARIAPERHLAVDLLGYCGPEAVPTLVPLAHHRDADVRLSAVRSLDRIRPDTAEFAAVLKAAMKDPDERARCAATWALRELGAQHSRHAAAALPELVAALDDPSPQVRLGAAQALVKVEPPTPAAIPGLIRALGDHSIFYSGGIDSSDDGSLRNAAAYALSRLGPQAKAAIPDLVAALQDRSPEVRSAADYALKQIRGEEAKQ